MHLANCLVSLLFVLLIMCLVEVYAENSTIRKARRPLNKVEKVQTSVKVVGEKGGIGNSSSSDIARGQQTTNTMTENASVNLVDESSTTEMMNSVGGVGSGNWTEQEQNVKAGGGGDAGGGFTTDKVLDEWGGNCTAKYWDKCKVVRTWFGSYVDLENNEKTYEIDCFVEPVICMKSGWTVSRCHLLCMGECNKDMQAKYDKYVSHDGECKAAAHG